MHSLLVKKNSRKIQDRAYCEHAPISNNSGDSRRNASLADQFYLVDYSADSALYVSIRTLVLPKQCKIVMKLVIPRKRYSTITIVGRMLFAVPSCLHESMDTNFHTIDQILVL